MSSVAIVLALAAAVAALVLAAIRQSDPRHSFMFEMVRQLPQAIDETQSDEARDISVRFAA